MAIDVSREFGYVPLVVVAAYVANMYFGYKVVEARKRYGVKFPALYAPSDNPNAKVFNCIQRGHQNFLEILPIFLALLVFGGLQHPRVAGISGILFVAARVLYFIDYSSGDPAKRLRGTYLGYTFLNFVVLCTISFALHVLFW